MTSFPLRSAAGLFGLLASLISLSCAHVRDPRSRPSSATLSLDFSAAEAWLFCQRAAQAPCEGASAATLGGQIAEAAASTFGSDPPAPVSPPTSGSVAALIAEMKRWPDVARRVASYLPAPVGGRIRAFVVANGNPWGDAYVRSIRESGHTVALDAGGEPVIVLNALLIAAQYRGTPRDQAASALGVLSHEAFHQLFDRYRRADPSWQRFEATDSPTLQLQMILLNEGIAHFIDREDALVRDGFPIDRSTAALAALTDAIHQLGSTAAGSSEAERIVRAASQGRYWDKYGSISGMLFSYGVHEAFGVEGLRRAIRCGPGDLVRQYDDATRLRPELPKISGELLDWSSHARFCSPLAARPPRL